MESLGNGPGGHHAQGQQQQHGGKRQRPPPQLGRQEQLQASIRLASLRRRGQSPRLEPPPRNNEKAA
jgi:hypothetical protein